MSTGNKTKKPPPFLVRLAAWGVVVLLSFALSAIIALHLPSVQKEIILGAVTRIEALTNLHVQIRSCLWLPFSSIYLTDVQIQAEGKQVLDCGKVRLNYKLSIKPPYILVKKLYLEKPFLLLERSADRRWLFAPSLKQGAKKAGDEQADPVRTYMLLPGIQVVSGVVKVLQQGKTVLLIKDISCAAHLNAVTGQAGPEIQVDFENFHARGQISGCGTWDIDGSGLIDGCRLQVRRMLFSGPNNCRVQVQGQWDIKNLENGQANLIVNNFPADAIPTVKPHLSGLSVASGSIAVARSEARWTFEHAQFTVRLDPFVPGAEAVQLCVLDGEVKGDGIPNQVAARLSGKLERILGFPFVSVSAQGQVGWNKLSVTADAKFDVQKDGIRIHSASLQHGREEISSLLLILSLTRAIPENTIMDSAMIKVRRTSARKQA